MVNAVVHEYDLDRYSFDCLLYSREEWRYVPSLIFRGHNNGQGEFVVVPARDRLLMSFRRYRHG